MRTTLNIDDQLLEDARRMTGISKQSALVREGLRALVERESARRLARLGGSEPDLDTAPRRPRPSQLDGNDPSRGAAGCSATG